MFPFHVPSPTPNLSQEVAEVDSQKDGDSQKGSFVSVNQASPVPQVSGRKLPPLGRPNLHFAVSRTVPVLPRDDIV